MEEFIDIYDKDRNRTGETVPRQGSKMKEGQYQLYVTAIVQDTNGKFLITQRSMDKSWGAGWWEVSGGGVLAGETAQEAVVREVGEEVGLDATGVTPELIYSYENVDLERGDNYFMDIYRFVLDFTVEDVVLQESEAIDCKLVTWDEISQLHDQGIFLHYSRIEKALSGLVG